MHIIQTTSQTTIALTLGGKKHALGFTLLSVIVTIKPPTNKLFAQDTQISVHRSSCELGLFQLIQTN